MGMRYNEILEAMQSVSSRQALHVVGLREEWPILVLYDTIEQSITKAILGTCSVTHFKNDLWIPSMILAQNGYGPLMYAYVAQYVTERNGILMPSDSRSKASKKTWEKFNQNPYITIVNDIKLSPTGFGLVGNGTIGLDAARARDEKEKQQNEIWHEKLIKTAIHKMRLAMEKV